MGPEKNYFKNILGEIENRVHPEVYHFRNGNHPGSTWYLKTACPMPNLSQLDKFGYGLLWSNVSDENPEIIKLVPHAYDWTGKEIPYMASVWIDIKSDVIFNYSEKVGYNIILVDRNIGNQFYVDTLRDLVTISRDNAQDFPDDIDLLDQIDNIEEIMNFLGKEIRSEDAVLLRNDFKILEGGKNKEE